VIVKQLTKYENYLILNKVMIMDLYNNALYLIKPIKVGGKKMQRLDDD
jgi:hypothetical protein